jgi:hypothetical protein
MASWTTTYSGLVEQLEGYTEDDSSEFQAAANGCINRAEERVFKDLDLSYFNHELGTSLGSGVQTLAKAFTESPVHSICLTAGLTYPERRTLAFVRMHGGSGLPLYFAENETTIYFAPTPDSAYAVNVTYNKRPTPLSLAQESNWFAVNVADLLLYAALVESEKFLIAPARAQEFEATYRQLLGPARAFWRGTAQTPYEPLTPTPEPQQTR